VLIQNDPQHCALPLIYIYWNHDMDLDTYWHSSTASLLKCNRLTLPKDTFLKLRCCVSPSEIWFCLHCPHPSPPLMATGSNWLQCSYSAGFPACLNSLHIQRPPVRWAFQLNTNTQIHSFISDTIIAVTCWNETLSDENIMWHWTATKMAPGSSSSSIGRMRQHYITQQTSPFLHSNNGWHKITTNNEAFSD